jgi:membrane fusion protein, multidrug efflux system
MMNTSATTEKVTSRRAEKPEATAAPTGAEVASRQNAGRRLLVIGGVAIFLLAGALIGGTLPRLRQEKEVNASAAEAASALPRVTVAVAKKVAPNAERVLPGTALPLMEAAIYARATGYLKTRLVDIGDRLKEGQLLAEISAPDIDDQLEQAKANLELSKANLEFARANAKLGQINVNRYERLVKTNTVSTEERDQAVATGETTTAQVASSLASIEVNKALVQKFTDLQSFEKITAPFAGVITARNVETGDLITADSTTRELFHLMRTDTLRVFVNVPQVFATSIKTGQNASVYLREAPQQQYQGKVTRTADALDPNTRTLLTEVDVPNPNDALRPGMYLQVKFAFDRKVSPLMIPSVALATRDAGPRVAVLDGQNRVRYREVQLGRDYGAEIQIVAGLKEGQQVVIHPGDDLPEGTEVEPVTLTAK